MSKNFDKALIFGLILFIVLPFVWGWVIGYQISLSEFRETKPCVDYAVWEYEQNKIPARCLEEKK